MRYIQCRPGLNSRLHRLSKVRTSLTIFDAKLAYPLEIWQVFVVRPVLFSGGANKAEDPVDLLHLTLAWKQGRIQDELPHDATHTPHVNGG